jgi:hypothetical protein
MERVLTFAWQRMPSARSGAFMGGLGALFVGLWWERPSLALITCGGLLVSISIVAVFTARRAK